MDRLIRPTRVRPPVKDMSWRSRRKTDVITVGFKHSGEYEDEYDPYIKVARIEKAGDTYSVGWFSDDGEEPSASNEYNPARKTCSPPWIRPSSKGQKMPGHRQSPSAQFPQYL